MNDNKKLGKQRDNKPWYEKLNIWIGIIAGICTILGISFSTTLYSKLSSRNSIYGTWYQVQDNEGHLRSTITFNSDGNFIDGSVGGTYSAENGKMILHYNPLSGDSTFDYEIDKGFLYLYKHGELRYVYSKKNLFE